MTRELRRRSAAIPLVVAPSLALILAGCGTTQPAQAGGYQGVCVNPTTQQRVDDDMCDDNDNGSGSNGALWYWYGMNSRYPAVGSRVTDGYSTSRPSGSNFVRGGAVASGGDVSSTTLTKAQSAPGTKSSVTRGGFGASSKGGSVGG